MAYSKTFLLLGLAFAVVVLMASEVSARDLSETPETKENEVDGYGHGGYGHGGYGHGGYGHGGRGGYGHGGRGGYGHGGRGGYGHGGRGGYGHGGHGHHGGHPDGTTEEQVETENGN